MKEEVVEGEEEEEDVRKKEVEEVKSERTGQWRIFFVFYDLSVVRLNIE